MKLFASQHAIMRARKRAHWRPEALEKMIERAYYAGVEPEDCPRGLREHLAALCEESQGGTAKIYGDFVYIFSPSPDGDAMALVTLYQLEHGLRQKARRAASHWWERQQCGSIHRGIARRLIDAELGSKPNYTHSHCLTGTPLAS